MTENSTLIPRFAQIHTLHSYPAALLNRDESGLAKRMPYGGSFRTRISSQALKRHWRDATGTGSFVGIQGFEDSVRSRSTVNRLVVDPLRLSAAAADDILDALEEEFNKGVYGARATEEGARQPLLLGSSEVEYLKSKAAEILQACVKEWDNEEKQVTAIREAVGKLFSLRAARNGEGENFAAFRRQTALPGGLMSALFGRMVTSDPGANVDAAVHVAHSMTVHEEESESDYYTVVDDLRNRHEDLGAAHIGDTELTAGLFYGYVVVDLPTLVSNLTGSMPNAFLVEDRTLAADVLSVLINVVSTVTPGAKLGSTAPYSYADWVMVEIGERQPRSLAAAFRTPVHARLSSALDALHGYIRAIDETYGEGESRRALYVGFANEETSIKRDTLLGIREWAAEALRAGSVER